jgi:hypothetical protein
MSLTLQLLCNLLIRPSDYNHGSTTSFDSSQHPFSLWVACVCGGLTWFRPKIVFPFLFFFFLNLSFSDYILVIQKIISAI